MISIEHRIWVGTNAALRERKVESDDIAIPLLRLFERLSDLPIRDIRVSIHGEAGEYIGRRDGLYGDGVNDWTGADRRNVIVAARCSSHEAMVLVYQALSDWERDEHKNEFFLPSHYAIQEKTHVWHPEMSGEMEEATDFDSEVTIY